MDNKYNNNGRILFEGISQIDNKTPIVCIVTGLDSKSSNSKTGDMLQTWILRKDIAPHTAVKQGLDTAICGDCKYASGNGCYVTVYQAPLQVWKTYQRGRYKQFTSADFDLLKGRTLRIGSYGDPYAVHYMVWHTLLLKVDGYTGYTHQWRGADKKWKFLMASADTQQERDDAIADGWRPFTTVADVSSKNPNDIFCPATAEGGNKASCNTCKLCSGNNTKAKPIAVVLHGTNWVIKRAKAAQTSAAN